ncbi:hypothetical protein [Streptomyces sp. NPDC051000]|uniref:hypothetical protein n=1 Tax=Streptomyces sp. NPDC051000 TaxID=3155520 RepID=UPI003406395C
MRRATGLATVVAVSGSAPRGPGTLSGVDAADDAFAVGLTCGGVLDVLITPARRQDLVRCDLPCNRDRRRRGRGAGRAPPGWCPGPSQQLGWAARRADGSYEGCPAGAPTLDESAEGRGAGRPDRYRGARGTTGRLCGTPVTLLVEPAGERPG